MRFVSFRLATALAAIAILVTLNAHSSAKADTKTPTVAVMAAPAGQDLNPDPNRQNFDYALASGQSVSDELYISNVGNKAVDVMVYARDAHTAPDGALAIDGLSQLPADSATWVTFGSGNTLTYNVRLKAAERIKLPFTLKVPNDATAGDHVGGILGTYGGTDGNLKIVSRIGVRLYTRVIGELEPALVVSNVKSAYTTSFWSPLDSVMKVSLTLTNKGNVALGGLIKASTLGLFGNDLATPGGIKVDEITPGQSINLVAEIPGLAQWGLYHNTVTVKPTVAKESLITDELPEISRDDWYFETPITWLVIAIAFAAGIWYFRFRRQRLKQRTEAWLLYTEAEAERKARLKQDAQ